MQYLLLINDDEELWNRMSEAERNAMYAEYGAFSQEVRARGAYVGGAQLQPVATATTVRLRDGEQVVTDGPFAETKEQLGGFYLVDVESVDEALELAARIPSARTGSIEVRPLVPTPAPAAT
jgi:hypothetical protein